MRHRAVEARPRRGLHVVWCVALALAAASAWAKEVRHLDLVAGHLYGPAALPDQATPTGRLSEIEMTGPFLEGHIAPFNNGAEEPNLPGEAAQGLEVDGKLCDGTLINEHADVGYVALMKGQLKLLLAAVDGGPNRGRVDFYLDDDWNWTIHDDIAIDPGFPVGVIKIDDFRWSTGPRPLPPSTQTARNYPGGVDQAGSKVTGEYIPGLLGDDDLDGRVDGVFNAVGSFPLTSAFLPGAPFSQTRRFVSDVPVSARQAAGLTLANARTHLLLVTRGVRPAAELIAVARERLALADKQFERAGEASLEDARRTAREVAQALVEPGDAERIAVQAERLREIIPTLLGEKSKP
jgi:hypothetical protein